MSKNLDSDLYGDIYGDDGNDFASPVGDETTTAEDETANDDSLPDKPVPGSSAPSSSSLSYSAQIAQQFSAYKQTPSQERQSKTPDSNRVTHAIPRATAAIPTSTSGDTVYGKKPSEMHDDGKLFIGGLSWDTTEEGLKDYFSAFGKVDAVTIMRDPTGTSRGFAFLTFEEANAVQAVVAREHTLDGKTIDPKRAIPREEHLRNTRYFVGGLSPSTTGDSMKLFFTAFGKVVDATVMVDRESGRSKGFGFVTFEDAHNAEQIVGKHLTMDDKQIEVKAAQPRSQREQARGSNIQDGNNTQAEAPALNSLALGGGGGAESMGFGMAQQMPMFFNRPMNPMAMMGGGGMQMMGMNPMMSASMGFNPGMMMNGMGMMGGANGMNAMQQMRMAMNPAWGNMMGAGMNPALMAGNMNIARMGAGGMNGTGNAGAGPARTANRGQHNFHPYSR